MDRAEPRIVAAGDVLRRVVEEADSGRILENDRAIARAELSGMGADGRDLDVLGEAGTAATKRASMATAFFMSLLQECGR